MEALEWKDRSGRPLTRGVLIAYAYTGGSGEGLRFAKVLETKMVEKAKAGTKTPRLVVQGVNDDSDVRSPDLHSKPSTINYPERTLIVQREQVPPPILKLLDSVAA